VTTLVAAGREAAINAAKWSEAASVSIFTEVEPNSISIFVRDRGVGFDLDASRLTARHRDVDSTAHEPTRRRGVHHYRRGDGTEVQLVMPRTT